MVAYVAAAAAPQVGLMSCSPQTRWPSLRPETASSPTAAPPFAAVPPLSAAAAAGGSPAGLAAAADSSNSSLQGSVGGSWEASCQSRKNTGCDIRTLLDSVPSQPQIACVPEDNVDQPNHQNVDIRRACAMETTLAQDRGERATSGPKPRCNTIATWYCSRSASATSRGQRSRG